MPLSLTTARQRLKGASMGSPQDIDAILRGLVEGDLDPEQRMTDLRARSFFFEDFLAASVDARFSSTAGSGTGNAALTTVAGAVNGTATLKSASDDGAHGANFSTVTLDQLNFKASQGGLFAEIYANISDVAEAYFFLGFTDTISTTVEGPIYMAAGAIDSDATDACGIVYDIDATTDVFTVGGVKNGTDTDPALSTITPADNTYFRARVEVDADGTVRGYINGHLIGTVANAVTTSVALTPAFFIGNRSANQVTLTVDWFACGQNR